MSKKVVIYSTPTCHYCNEAKDFFKVHGVDYVEYNVQTDLTRRKEMVDKSGQMGVPVIFVDNKLVMGFDEDKLKKLLGIKY